MSKLRMAERGGARGDAAPETTSRQQATERHHEWHINVRVTLAFTLKCVTTPGSHEARAGQWIARNSTENNEFPRVYSHPHGWPSSCSSTRHPEARSVTARCSRQSAGGGGPGRNPTDPSGGLRDESRMWIEIAARW